MVCNLLKVFYSYGCLGGCGGATGNFGLGAFFVGGLITAGPRIVIL
jgi:hypothetical protein